MFLHFQFPDEQTTLTRKGVLTTHFTSAPLYFRVAKGGTLKVSWTEFKLLLLTAVIIVASLCQANKECMYNLAS